MEKEPTTLTHIGALLADGMLFVLTASIVLLLTEQH
jgi:hypothetical protein